LLSLLISCSNFYTHTYIHFYIQTCSKWRYSTQNQSIFSQYNFVNNRFYLLPYFTIITIPKIKFKLYNAIFGIFIEYHYNTYIIIGPHTFCICLFQNVEEVIAVCINFFMQYQKKRVYKPPYRNLIPDNHATSGKTRGPVTSSYMAKYSLDNIHVFCWLWKDTDPHEALQEHWLKHSINVFVCTVCITPDASFRSFLIIYLEFVEAT